MEYQALHLLSFSKILYAVCEDYIIHFVKYNKETLIITNVGIFKGIILNRLYIVTSRKLHRLQS